MSKQPWTRYFRFSLRSALVVFLVLAVPLGWLVAKRNAYRERVAALALDGGHVVPEFPAGSWGSSAVLGRLLRGTELNEALFARPYQVSFYPPDATDETLAHLHPFADAKVVVLAETKITDAALGHLAEFRELRHLDLSRTAVTDAGLPQLAGLTQLELLQLAGTQVTPAGIAELQKSLPDCAILP
jgi:hypothetical protein